MSNEFPARLYVEVTTRCNLRCSMCVKQTEGCGIEEADMPFEVFSRLASCLPHADVVLLNGVGEPLLHPRLAEMVRFARTHMRDGAWVGFQSNGLALTPRLAAELLEAGLGTMCLSVDSIASAEMETLHGAARLPVLPVRLPCCAKPVMQSPAIPSWTQSGREHSRSG